MHNEPLILKERLKQLIGNKKVTAALFYTFNFDPKFFENYVMPLLVPEQQFVNNSIANNIYWRMLYKDRKVPPVTVYYDQYAKSLDAAPMLDYKSVAISMRSVGKNKGNFHPKLSFILAEEKGRSILIAINGSNNITQGGWCENQECVSEIVIENSVFYPRQLVNMLTDFIEFTYVDRKELSDPAEWRILDSLRRRGFTNHDSIRFYDSYQGPFDSFLRENVFIDESVYEVEIISPYFKLDTKLLAFFKDIKVKIQAPVLGDYVLIKEQLYNEYKNNGVVWYKSDVDPGRNVHSKMYRFYGDKKVYTIIGSVNFTGPAWTGFTEKNEIFNIENAVLYVESPIHMKRILHKEIGNQILKFIGLDKELENKFEERVSSPEIEFIIDWRHASIRWNKVKEVCRLYLIEDVQIDLNLSKEVLIESLSHSKEIFDSIKRNPIFKVIESVAREERLHYYYPNQVGFDQKPIDYRFSADDIIDAWELLGTDSEVLNDWIINRVEVLAEFAEDESGRLLNEVSQSKSLLNEMARHLYGLVRLEQYLFDEHIWKRNIAQKTSHYNELRYYLFHDNVDTLVSYLKDIEKMYTDKRLLGGYYWLLMMIIKEHFYSNKLLAKMIKGFGNDDKEKRMLKESIQKTENELLAKLTTLEKSVSIHSKKIGWAKTLFQV